VSENLDLVRLLCQIADEAFRAHPHLKTKYPDSPAARQGSAAELIKFVDDRPGHDRRYAIDCTKIERELGYRANVSLQWGLQETFAWYFENEAWWRAVMDGSYQQWMQTHYRVATT